MKTITTVEQLEALHSDESAIIRASGKYPDGGTFTDCYALPVPMDITDSEDRYWRVIVHGDTWLQSLVKETGIQLPATLIHPLIFDTADVWLAAKEAFEIRDDPYDDDEWDDLGSSDKELYECQARAVLGAVGEVEA